MVLRSVRLNIDFNFKWKINGDGILYRYVYGNW